jgi:hypothetical protein
MMKSLVSGLALAVSMLAMPALAAPAAAATPEAPAAASAATPADVDAWLASADKAMAEQTVKSGHVQWVYQTYVNDDTAGIVADSDAAGTLLQVAQAKQAAAFAKVPGLSPETLRRLTMIRTGITTPAPSTPGAAEEFSSLQAHIQGIYATGHATRGGERLGSLGSRRLSRRELGPADDVLPPAVGTAHVHRLRPSEMQAAAHMEPEREAALRLHVQRGGATPWQPPAVGK